MRNLLALGGAALLIFLGLGWYLDWYRLKATPGADGHRNINIDLNTNKITEDVSKGKEKVRDWLSKDQNTQTVNPNGPNTNTNVTPGNQTSFRPEQSPYNPPSDNFTPAPPGTGPRLPSPQ